MNQSAHPETNKLIEKVKDLFKPDNGKSSDNINPPQTQDEQPGLQTKMDPEPISIDKNYKAAGKLADKVALVTGGDSGIGRAVVYHFIMEGAKVAFVYLNEQKDAEVTLEQAKKMGGECIAIAADLSHKETCANVVKQVMAQWGKINCLVNNVAQHYPEKDITDITADIFVRTFQTNFFSYFYMSQLVLPHLHEDDTIINTTSVTAYHGHKELVDYASAKGAIVAFTRSLSGAVVDKKIRVNAVAPGPIWTPLIPASFTKEQVAQFGANTPMKRAGQPAEVAPCYVFLASQDSSYITGQVLHPNGGEIING
jgi:NAD(P)-dependent dehydrogenase (short-subunit alcohol dehydrogenase family)